MSDKLAYTILEFCETHGVGKSFTFEQIAAGKLKSRKAGRKTLILRADAEDWLSNLPHNRKDAA